MKNFRLTVFIKMVAESVAFAASSLRNDKFRTTLSLLGVSVGIFSIVAILSFMSALEKNIAAGLESFKGDCLYIQQWPFSPEEGEQEYKWWEYRTRPNITETEYNFLNNNIREGRAISYISTFYGLFKYKRNSFSNGYIIATSPGFEEMTNINLESGRSFSTTELSRGSNVAILGHDVAEALFTDNANPVGSTIKIKGIDATVIGIVQKKGKSIVSIFDMDNAVMIPLNFGKNLYNVSLWGGMMLTAPKDGVSIEAYTGELRNLMRTQRRLRPSEKDNFAINSMDMLVKELGGLTEKMNIIGWIIGGFSLLIGGFGIANIMFISVKERTTQIGIQKALGAKNYVIMTQFLAESAFLSVAGGIIGILIVFIALLFYHSDTFHITLTFSGTLTGLVVSLITGILSGSIPAMSAARLNPVDAINS